jgi:hypothetical protein
MTLPISFMEVARSSRSPRRRAHRPHRPGGGRGEGYEDLAFGFLVGGQLRATGFTEGVRGLGALLDLFRGDLADLVVGELVPQLVLLVADRGREHAERAHLDLVLGLHGRGHLLVDLRLQRSVRHYTAFPW